MSSEVPVYDDPLSLRRVDNTPFNQPDMTPDVQNKLSIRSGLETLPQPLNDYEIVPPDDPESTIANDVDSTIHSQENLDAEEIELEKKLADEQFAESMKLKCSTSVNRKLPFPSGQNYQILRPSLSDATELQKAEELIKKEMLALNQYDNIFAEPPTDQLTRTQIYKTQVEEYLKKNPIEFFTEDEMMEADLLLEKEMEIVKANMDHGDISLDTYCKVWDECYEQVMFLASQNRFTRASLTSKKERIDAMDRKLELYRQHMNQIGRKANKIENKCKILLGGYQTRAHGIINGLSELTAQIDLATIECSTYRMLKNVEDIAIPRRINAISDEVERQIQRESIIQTRYKNLVEEIERKREEFSNGH